MCKKGSYFSGVGLMGIGTIMLLGVLNLGFLIPLFIAGCFIYIGWNIIKKARGEQIRRTAMNPLHDMMPHYSYDNKKAYQVDELDLWEKEINRGGTSQ
jgi:divalent metal cation (Fe/Co/Zn/Cd) transporter